ncbi:MAG: hypothetical protein KDN05_07645 [Verrucomicrobiae bacterium]|nr:hypothetical protein [Verrucomicrobiae bacterium]
MKPGFVSSLVTVLFGIAASTQAQTVLLTDNFNSYADWDATGVAADQGGTYAGTGYTTATPNPGWISHSSDANQPVDGNTLKVDTGDGNPTYVSLDRNFATDANSADLPLAVSFYVQAAGGGATNWAAVNLGSQQNVMVNNGNTKFGTLFRNSSNDTQQFNAGNDLIGQGAVSYNQATGSTVKLVFSDTVGTGSAFNGNGSKVEFYVDNVLAQTFLLSQMTADDGYLTFQCYGTRGVFDNVVVETVTGTPAFAEQDGTWTATADGNWTNAANWLDNNPAAGTDRTANFTGSTGVTVAMDAPRPIGNLVFDNADYTINGPSGLTLSTSSGSPTINVGDTGGQWLATVSASLAASNGFTKTGNGILSLTSPLSGTGPVVVEAGTLEMLEASGAYNWYGPSSTTVEAGAILSINSHSALFNLTLAGGELASSGVDPIYGYGSWSLQGDSCTATGGVVSTISAQQVDFNTLTNGFVVESGSTLEIIGSLKNGTLRKNGPGLMVLMAPRTGTDNTLVNEGTLQISDAGGSLRFRPTTVGAVNSIAGDASASLAFDGTMVLDLSAATLEDGNTWELIDTGSFSTPGSLTFGANFLVMTDSQDFTETSPGSGVWELTDGPNTWTFEESSGVLSLAVAASNDYETWGSTYGLSAGSEGDDLDDDGMTNLEEYAFGLIPNSGSSVNPIAVPLDKPTGTFSYTRRDPSLQNPALTYTVWHSTDLSGLTQDTGAVEGTPVLNGEVETVPVTISNSLLSNPKLFIQVRAETP